MSTATATAPASATEIATTGGHTPALVRTGKSLAQLEAGIAHYPDEIRTEVRWLQGFYLDHCRNNAESLRSICAKLGHDKSREYFANLIGGYYFKNKAGTWMRGGKGWSEFVELMVALRRHAQLIARTGKLPFVQTPSYRVIANFIDTLRAPSAVCRIGGIVGYTGGQTSESFKFYRTLNNHGAVIHIEAPSGGSPTQLRSKILEQYHLSGQKIERRGALELREHVHEGRTIIIDNAQELYVARYGARQPAFSFIRELYDDRGPTIILKLTEEFFRDMTGTEAKGYFEQFIGRMGGLGSMLRLPDFAPDADLKCIARHFRVADSAVDDYLFPWSRQPGRIRIVFHKLQLALQLAGKNYGDKLTLDELQAAHEYTPPSTGADVDVDESEVES